MCPICNLTFRPVDGSTSPGARPHITQVKPFRSRTSARNLAAGYIAVDDTPLLALGFSLSIYSPGFKSAESLCVMIGQPSSSRSSRTLLAYLR